MPDLPPLVLPSPENPAQARRGRRPLKTLPDRSSHGWASPDRAPRLRRAAVLVEAQAKGSDNPVAARALARKMRARAQLVELRGYEQDALDEAMKLMRELAGTTPL